MGRSVSYKEVVAELEKNLERQSAACTEQVEILPEESALPASDAVEKDDVDLAAASGVSKSKSGKGGKGGKGAAKGIASVANSQLFSRAVGEDANERFIREIRALIATYGPGNNPAMPWPFGQGVLALHKLLSELENITKTQVWYANASSEFKQIILSFIKRQQHIHAFYNLVDCFKKNFGTSFTSEEIASLTYLLASIATVEALYFQLYTQVAVKPHLVAQAKVLECYLQELVVQQDNLHYYRLNTDTIQISGVTKFDDLAHALICNKITLLFPGRYSRPRRQLMSGLLDYLRHCPRDSCNLESARNLFFLLLKQPCTSIKLVLERVEYKEETLQGQQGFIKKTRQALFTLSGSVAEYSKAAANGLSYIAGTVNGSDFCQLLESFRATEEAVPSNESLEQGFLKDVGAVLQPLFMAVGFSHQGKGGMYPIDQDRFTAEMADQAVRHDSAAGAASPSEESHAIRLVRN